MSFLDLDIDAIDQPHEDANFHLSRLDLLTEQNIVPPKAKLDALETAAWRDMTDAAWNQMSVAELFYAMAE